MFHLAKRIKTSRVVRLARGSRPSAAMTVASVALFFGVTGGGAYAATQISDGSLGHSKLAPNSVWHSNLGKGSVHADDLSSQIRAEISKAGTPGPRNASGPQGQQGSKGDTGAAGPQGPKGDTGTTGPQGPKGNDGKDGLNAAASVVTVPTIAQSSGKNPNPDSGDAGDGGWYFSGDGDGGSAALTSGELKLDGPGIDAKTAQGGIGIAKAFNNVPLRDLDALTYQWHVNEVDGVSKQAPTIHVTVAGLTNDSKFSSGFANLVYNPTLNGVTPSESAGYESDGFAPNAAWYSTTESNINKPGGQNSPQTLATFVTQNPNAVITQISLDNGGTSGGTGSFDAGADNLLLGFGHTNTRYDFGG
jgi:Collagen triple helix repeat (20 copies)